MGGTVTNGPEMPAEDLPEEDAYQYCDEHGEYSIDSLFCPGCEQVDHDIDDAIEQARERVAKGGSYYG